MIRESWTIEVDFRKSGFFVDSPRVHYVSSKIKHFQSKSSHFPAMFLRFWAKEPLLEVSYVYGWLFWGGGGGGGSVLTFHKMK